MVKAGFLAALLTLWQSACAPAPPPVGDDEKSAQWQQQEQREQQQQAGQEEPAPESFEVWLCPVHHDQQMVAAGSCPICQRDLVRRFLVSSYSCPMHPHVGQDQPGACPICAMELVATTRQLQWYCADNPDEVSNVPGGICSESGEPMVVRSLPMAHGDHNPRHGGIVFMAPHGHYHLEGVLLPEGEFRLYFYDELTQPVDPDVFAARIGTRPLEPTEGAAYLTTSFDPPETYPVEVALHVRFPSVEEEGRFDFLFVENMGEGDTH